MANIFKFDLYKMRRANSTWGILLCVFALTLVSMAITYTAKTNGELPTIIGEVGAQATNIPLKNMTVVDWYIDSISGDFLALFIAVFSIMFTCADYGSGYIKNIYGYIKNKWQYIASKFAVVLIFVILTMLVAFFSAICFNLFVVRSESFGCVQSLLKYSALKILLLVAFGMVGVCIAIIVQKAAFGLILVMGYSFIVADLLYTAVNQIAIYLFAAASFNAKQYSLIGNIASLDVGISAKGINLIVAVSATVLLLTAIVGSISFAKRDI